MVGIDGERTENERRGRDTEIRPKASRNRCRFSSSHIQRISLASEMKISRCDNSIDFLIETRPQNLTDVTQVNFIALFVHRTLFTEVAMQDVDLPD